MTMAFEIYLPQRVCGRGGRNERPALIVAQASFLQMRPPGRTAGLGPQGRDLEEADVDV